MKKAKNFHIIWIFKILLILSCGSSNNTDKNDAFDEDVVISNEFLGYELIEPTPLRITAYFDECGEFGGHFEELLIFSIGNSKYFLNLIKYDLSCDPPPPPIYGIEVDYRRENVINNDSLIISNLKAKIILRYIQEVVSAKLLEDDFVHSGQIFTIENTDSTMFLSLYENNEQNEVRYVNFIEDIGFKSWMDDNNH